MATKEVELDEDDMRAVMEEMDGEDFADFVEGLFKDLPDTRARRIAYETIGEASPKDIAEDVLGFVEEFDDASLVRLCKGISDLVIDDPETLRAIFEHFMNALEAKKGAAT